MYRVGSLNCTVQGTPEIVAGKRIAITELGGAATNYFYVTEARHVLSPDGYFTYIKGKACSVGPESGDLSLVSISSLSSLLGGSLGGLAGGLGSAAGALGTAASAASAASSAASAVSSVTSAAGGIGNITSGLGGLL